MSCNCWGFLPGPDVRECFTCGRDLLVDASIWPVFDLRTQRMVESKPEISTVEPDWQFGFMLVRQRGKLTIKRFLAGNDRAAQLLEAA